MQIEFGRWRLVPVDSLNWELCHLHAVTKGKNAGAEQWNRIGRYYSYNTLPNAVLFAAEQELREGGEVVQLRDALRVWQQTVDALKADLLAAIGGEAA